MKLFRFLPRAVESWVGLAAGLPTMIRLAWVSMAVSLAAGAASGQWPRLAYLVDQVAAAAFAVVWLRFVALGERPAGRIPFRLGRRELFFTLFWMAANAFVGYPAAVFASTLAPVTGIDAKAMAVPLMVVAYALMGAFLLLPVEYALDDVGKTRPPTDLLLQGGVAAGIGLLVVWGPPALALVALSTVPTPSPLAAKALALLPQYLGMAATAGYLGLVWRTLLADAR
ncbi:MAG: hypothetical protein HYU60_03365 [Magnetospirillum sp.]|nr:hypothetical protein [Magnetospirillum sp.]